jgi:hypothetical protein
MTDKHLREITIAFPDVKKLLQQRSVILKNLNRVRRKLKTQQGKYSFLIDLVGIDSSDTRLDNAIVKYFKSLGFPNIKAVNKKSSDEDIQLFVDNRLIIIEATGSANPTAKDLKVFQIIKHVPDRKTQYPNLKVVPTFIINQDNEKDFWLRNKPPFDKRQIHLAKSNGMTITTTVDLLMAFVQIKEEKISPEEFIDKLCIPGLFKIK